MNASTIDSKYQEAFDERLKMLQPYMDYVLTLVNETRIANVDSVVLAGGAAAFLFGRFNTFNDLDFFIPISSNFDETVLIDWKFEKSCNNDYYSYEFKVYSSTYNNKQVQLIFVTNTLERTLLNFDLYCCQYMFNVQSGEINHNDCLCKYSSDKINKNIKIHRLIKYMKRSSEKVKSLKDEYYHNFLQNQKCIECDK